MGQHVLTVIGGFGLRVIPHAPFQARLGSDGRVLRVERANPARAACVIVERPGACDVELGDGTSDSDEVFDIAPGPPYDSWFLETSAVSFRFPRDFTLHSVEDGSPSPFDLVGDAGELIYVQTARRRVEPRQLVLPGSTILDVGDEVLEVSYAHEGAPWRQRHRLVMPSESRTFVLTLQARGDRMERVRSVVDAMAASACLTRDPPRAQSRA